MPRRLSSIQLKLQRAQKHLKAVVASERSLRTSTKNRIIVRRTDDPAFLEFVLRLAKPRSTLSPVIGDCLHNMRAALDHLVYAIAETEASRLAKRRTESLIRASMFPIT